MPENLAAFAALTVLVCLTPGPAVLFVLAQTALRGSSAGLAAALGINTGNLIYYALSAAGLLALIAASGAAFLAVKWIGVAYLAWLGFSALTGPPPQSAPVEHPASQSASSYGSAAIVQLANPKAVLYFLALLPQFVDPGGAVWAQTLVLATVGCTIEMIVLSGYVFSASLLRTRFLGGPARLWLQRGSGVAFLGLATAAAVWRRAT